MYLVYVSTHISILAGCSVGVVVITSALHAVGHGFETHTEYFFSPELNFDSSFCLVAPIYSLHHFSVVKKQNHTFLGRLICCILVQKVVHVVIRRDVSRKRLGTLTYILVRRRRHKNRCEVVVSVTNLAGLHTVTVTYIPFTVVPQQYQNENDMTVSYIITCHCNCHVDDRKVAALSSDS